MKRVVLFFLPLIFVSAVFADKPEQPVDISGDRMEVLERGEITRFLGNVKLVRKKDVVTSDIMEHYEKKNYVVGKGNVHLIAYPEEDVKLEAFSDRLTYNIDNRKSILTGNPELSRIDEENPEDRIKMAGEVIKLSSNEKRVHVQGDARVEHGRMTATGQLLDYDYEIRKIVLSGGSPRIYQDDEQVKANYSAETVTIFIDEQRVIMEGNVKASIYPKNR
ncbi:hypothetical protein GTN42_03675 [bacterium]|nr:hypothetical protein [bacterium]